MLAKITILFAALAAVNAYGLISGHLINTGVSARSQVQDKMGNYAFGYDIKDGKGATNSRSEVGDGHGNVKGSYTLADIDGRARKVEYVADGHGFRAVVKTNEPGTAASAPAAALIASPYAAPSDNVVSHVAAAPALHGYASHGAPLVAAAPIAYGGLVGHGGLIGLGGIKGVGLGLNGYGLGLNGYGLGLNGYGLGLNGIGLGIH
ncbi:hypothetical protein JTE90_014368 [Oedothorax gibbosus]|uniref:Adult-specific rigid cuticular protein 15.7 n=1 Tax=Oedothorax gibbosus TaxID=931172 RepID=A0AAV6UE22_9ARAC|nr:hypothetical protein JTE90_014368 [Oedothorax gibbosus]